ncbi:MAG: hypothetical protein N4A63_13685 [Vallitalea sp.]|nr:hypothetical protein [Vallitalea sp.]
MSLKTKYILISILIIILTIVLITSTKKNNNSINETLVNENLIKAEGFSINSVATELNTSAKGTIFIKEVDGNKKHVKIITWIEIDPNDWGGITFYIPKEWFVSNIISSYPENKNATISQNYVAKWVTAGKEWYNCMVDVGRNRSYIPDGGGIGTVVIDLVLDKNENEAPETFKFCVAIGCDEKKGIKIIGPDYIDIEIPISTN